MHHLALGLLDGPLFVLELLQLLVFNVHGDDAHVGEIPLQKFFKVWQDGFLGPICSRLVINEELVKGRIRRRRLVWRTARDGLPRVRLLIRLRAVAGIRMLQSANEELSRVGNVLFGIRMHGVLAQEVDAEFLARLGEAHEAVQSEHVGEDAAPFVEMHHAEELERGFLGAGLESAVFGGAVVVVDAVVLLVQGLVEDGSPDAGG